MLRTAKTRLIFCVEWDTPYSTLHETMHEINSNLAGKS